MPRRGAVSALLYRRFLIVAFVGLVLLLVGSVSVSAQDATTEVTTPQSDTGTAADDQYNDGGGGNNDGGDVSNPKDVIPDTTSKKPLPNTGGVPLLGLAVGALALVGVGFSVLRASIRRDL